MTEFTGWSLPGPGAVIATQTGVILAMLGYFWSDVFDMGVGVVRAAKGKRDSGARLAAQLLASAAVAAAVVLLAERYAADVATSPLWIGWLSVGGAVTLIGFDRMCMTVKRVEHSTYADMILLGIAQAIALFPGMRSAGAPVTVGRLLGYERDEAVRLSMLSGGLPLAAVLVKTLVEAYGAGTAVQFTRSDLIAGAVSFIMALASLASLMGWLRRSTFMPFALYRLLVAAVVLVLAYELVSF